MKGNKCCLLEGDTSNLAWRDSANHKISQPGLLLLSCRIFEAAHTEYQKRSIKKLRKTEEYFVDLTAASINTAVQQFYIPCARNSLILRNPIERHGDT
jgi:hypothetical protein